MDYIYHRVVDNMQGNTLYPLNQLKNVYLEAYKKHLEKYKGREHLLETKIPILDCLWNDVLHFTAVEPQILFNNLVQAGFDAKELVWKRWYKIPIFKIDLNNTVTCIYRRDVSLIPDSRSFALFDSDKMADYRNVPDETLEYYKEQSKKGLRPLFFHRVPHILYKGTLGVEGVEILELG